MLPSKLWIDETASKYLAPSDSDIELIHIRIPAGQTAIISHFGNEIDDARGWGQVQWDVNIDGVPQKGYSPIKDQLGTIPLPRVIPFGYIQATRDIVITCRNPINYLDGLGAAQVNGNYYKIGVTIKGGYADNA